MWHWNENWNKIEQLKKEEKETVKHNNISWVSQWVPLPFLSSRCHRNLVETFVAWGTWNFGISTLVSSTQGKVWVKCVLLQNEYQIAKVFCTQPETNNNGLLRNNTCNYGLMKRRGKQICVRNKFPSTSIRVTQFLSHPWHNHTFSFFLITFCRQWKKCALMMRGGCRRIQQKCTFIAWSMFVSMSSNTDTDGEKNSEIQKHLSLK